MALQEEYNIADTLELFRPCVNAHLQAIEGVHDGLVALQRPAFREDEIKAELQNQIVMFLSYISYGAGDAEARSAYGAARVHCLIAGLLWLWTCTLCWRLSSRTKPTWRG